MHQNTIEIIKPKSFAREFRYGVLDFDGTISLIREGWQQIMIPYFTDEMCSTPKGREMNRKVLADQALEFIFINTGKQTIYQCIELANRIRALGGEPHDPQDYKDEYQRRLLVAIDHRLAGLADGRLDPQDLMVPGSLALLALLRSHGVSLYLASGTDDVFVQKEAALLGVSPFFEGHIYGAQRDYKTFSKKMVIDRIVNENNLSGESLLGFGDGYVEIEDIKSVGGFACGVATNEAERCGIDEWKRERLIRAGADIIIPDYQNIKELEQLLFNTD